MARKKVFYCQECSHKVPRWMGKCPNCESWNSIIEEPAMQAARGGREDIHTGNSPTLISEVIPIHEERFSTGLPELDRVMGGGIVPGSLILLGGDPGIGKSTILLQVAGNTGDESIKILYISGEESIRQIRLRADRLGVKQSNIFLHTETEISYIEKHIAELEPRLVIIDSIQTMYHPEVRSAPGSVSQVRECTSRLMSIAKNKQISIIIVGHVTKEGMLAGPKVLEHMVDVVLHLEGQKQHGFRLLRGGKNRFGSTNEVGVFEMGEAGLIEVANPSTLFMTAHPEGGVPGSVIVPTMEGTRPLLVEMQALICPSGFGMPRRMTTGLDSNRVTLIMAVLEKRVGLQMGNQDAYVNVVGGVRIDEPAVDLGVAIAMASSFKERPVEKGMAVMGEVGLTGEIRSISGIERRVSEAKQLGFECCMIPSFDLSQVNVKNIETIGVNTVSEAIDRALEV